jgi:hypothetical protein
MSISRRDFIKLGCVPAFLIAADGLATEAATIMTTPETDFQKVFYEAIKTAAKPTAAALGMPNMIPINKSLLGDFPWFWQNGTNFNEKTYSWLNNVFAYNPDGFIGINGAAFTTAYFNVLLDTAYVLSAAEAEDLNKVTLANAAVVNTIITDWTTTQGAIPPANNTQAAQLNYIMTNVLGWGTPGLTLNQLRNSTDPPSLLPNMPEDAETLVNDLMTYLANTSSVANIQAAVLSFNNQLAQTRLNISPAPAAVGKGWMQTSDDKGNLLIVPQVNIAESTGTIQKNLFPPTGQGKTFTAKFTISQGGSNKVNPAASGVGSLAGDVFSLIRITPKENDLKLLASVSPGSSPIYELNVFSADLSQQSADVELTFNGVTTVTPLPDAYDITSGKGWFNPDPVKSAVNYNAGKSGYRFLPAPQYRFGANGDFGFVSRLMVSQQPLLKLTYNTDNYAAYRNIFDQQIAWEISFLGVPPSVGSQYSSQTSFDAVSQTAAVTFVPVTPTDQLAYIIGGEVNWLGA